MRSTNKACYQLSYLLLVILGCFSFALPAFADGQKTPEELLKAFKLAVETQNSDKFLALCSLDGGVNPDVLRSGFDDLIKSTKKRKIAKVELGPLESGFKQAPIIQQKQFFYNIPAKQRVKVIYVMPPGETAGVPRDMSWVVGFKDGRYMIAGLTTIRPVE